MRCQWGGEGEELLYKVKDVRIVLCELHIVCVCVY